MFISFQNLSGYTNFGIQFSFICTEEPLPSYLIHSLFQDSQKTTIKATTDTLILTTEPRWEKIQF